MQAERFDKTKAIEASPPEGRVAWCIFFAALNDIEENVGEHTFGLLKDQIVSRIHSVNSNLKCVWDQQCVFVSPGARVNDWLLAHDVTNRLLEKFSFEHGVTTARKEETLVEQDIFLTPVIGLSEVEKDDAGEAFGRARAAAVSIAGDNGEMVTFYEAPEPAKAGLPNFKLRQSFIRCLRERKFQLAYQPKVELETGLLYGLEALIRPPADKYSPLHSVSPEGLVGLAIQTNTLTEFSVFVLESALWQLEQWRCLVPSIPITMSVNVMPRTLIEGWGALLAAIPASGQQGLVLELTESFDDVSGSMDLLNERLTALRNRGVEISIDDFGKGMSNIDRLTSIPCDEIKLDRLLINQATQNEANGNLVASMINVANHYGIRVVAEGIENNKQWQFLSKTNCQVGQGFYISRPLPVDQVYLLLKRLADDRISSSF